ncbi:MAG: PAS domain S-box protein [Acidobacteriia bacterium]|nr:PAS domain S-box protein [Terriglobia bacterium]
MNTTTLDGGTPSPALLRVLILEDSPRDAKLAASVLEGGGYTVQFEVTDSPEVFRESLEKTEYDVILADFNLRNWTAIDALEILKRSGKDVPLIVVTGSIGDEAAVECIKRGAADYVLKDRPARLPLEVRRALEEKRLREEREQAEEALRQANRALTAISAVNQAILHTTEEPLLLQEVCRCVIEHAGYRMAWVGFLSDGEPKRINPIAQAGFEPDYLHSIDVRWDDSERGRGPTGTAARTRQPVIVRNTATAAGFAPWRAEATARGYASVIGLPLLTGENLLGVLTIYSAQPGAFDKQEVDLLTEMADDLAFGIQALRTRAERGRAEEALRESEGRYRDLVESSNDWVWQVDENAIYTYAGPQCRELLGYEPEEIIGKTPFDLMPPEEQQRVGQAFSAIAAQRAPFRALENTNLHKDGHLVILETNGTPVIDERGIFRGYRGMDRDITEHKRAAEALQESEERFRSLFENATVGIYRTTPEGRILMANPALVRMLGYEDLAGLAARNLEEQGFEPSYPRQVFREHMEKDGEVKGLEAGWTRRDGSLFFVRESGRVVRGESGEALYYDGIVEDVTERKRAESALEERTAYLNTLIEISPLGIVTLDTQCRVQMCNPAFERLFLYRRAEIEGANLDELLAPPESLSEALELSAKCLSGIAVHTASRRRRKDGTLIDVEIHGVPLVMHGELIGQLGLYHDITERKRAEEAIRASEQRYRLLFERNLAGVCRATLDGRFLDCNDAYARILGYQSREEILAQPVLSVYFDPAEREAYWAKVRERGTLSNYELRLRRKDGSPVWVLANDTLLEGEVDGQVVKEATLMDITERKRAEEALQVSERQLAQAMDMALLAPWEFNPATGIFTFNDRFYALYGTTAEREGGYQMSAEAYAREFLYPEDVHIVADEVAKALAITNPDAAWALEHRIRRRDGEMRHIVVRMSVIKNSAGLTIKTRGVNQDITERKRAEVALIEERQLLHTLLDNLPDVIYFKDRESRFTRINKAHAKVFGLSDPAQAIGKTDFDFFTDEHAQQAFADEQEIIRTGQPILAKEEKETWPDGRETWVSTTKMPLRDANGNILGTFGVSRDVTERKSMEGQLRQTAKIEAIGRLAGGVAHDFNNLLTIISGYGQLLQERLSPEALGPVEEILKASDRAATLTRQLLAFSRRQILAPQVLDLNSVVANMEKMLGRLIGEDIELATVQQPGLGRVKADPGQIEQVIMNLVVNSRDAMPEGGKITIETANVHLDKTYARRHPGATPGPQVMLAVSDTGMGMDAETLTHVFEPFFTTKEKGKGTGLGLATVYGIVKQSAGYIWVYSEPGRGSTFKIYLPRVEEPGREAEPAKAGSELAKGSETVLVVEDEEGVRSLVCETLESHGYKVLEARGADDALSIFEQYAEPIHLLLTDVVMPQMGGKELAKRLSSVHPETKVLYMSGYTDNAIVRHGVLEGGTPFLQKPFVPQTLVRKVRQVLDTKQGDQR